MQLSQITDDLFIGTTPGPEDYDSLRALGVGLVINMRVERRPRRDPHNPGIPTLWLPTFDTPLLPIPQRMLRRGVEAAVEVLQAGRGVYVHCAAGVHRSVAMAAAILIARGWSMPAALRAIKAGRPAADPEAKHIYRPIQKFAQNWEKSPPVQETGHQSP